MSSKLLRDAQRQYNDARFSEAAATYRELIELEGGSADIYVKLGRCLLDLGELDAAADTLERATELGSKSADVLYNLGAVQLQMGKLDEARLSLRSALNQAPHFAPNPTVVMNAARLPKAARDLPLWRGEPLDGRRLLVYSNQGIGDAIQWARYLPMLRKLGCYLVLQCQAPLANLMRQNQHLADEVVSRRQSSPACDLVAPMSGLRYLLKAGNRSTPEGNFPYLHVSNERIEHWRQKLEESSALHVGFAWAGNPDHPRDHERSLPSIFLEPVLSIPNVRFFSLQFDDWEGDPLSYDSRVRSLAPEIKDFVDTAAIISVLDLVITVDTSIAHLAGAMDRPVWLLIPRFPDSRWITGPEEAPIYPSVELFRQTRRNDWLTIVGSAAKKLDKKAKSASSGSRKKNANPTSVTQRVTHSGRTDATHPLSKVGSLRLKRCRYGLMLFHTTDLYVGRSFDIYGEFSEGEIEVFRQIVRPGHTVLDVGANLGAHTIPFSRMVGRRGQVWAFEPQRVMFQILTANVALNGLENVRTVNAGLGNEEGKITVPSVNYSQKGNYGSLSLVTEGAGDRVPLQRIDGLGLNACNLIKIDVEGMEQDVRGGAAATIARFRPWMYVENDRKEKSPQLIHLLHDLGYRLYWHLPPLFNPRNFFRNPDNVFKRTVSCDLLCLPMEIKQKMVGLSEVTSPDDWPLAG